MYVLGDLLGSSPAALAWQALLPILDDAGLRMEPRRFWNTSAAGSSTALGSRTVRLVAGRRTIDAHTTLDAAALARIERLTTCRVPRGSLVVTMETELAVHARALVPEGAGLRLLRPSAVLEDPPAFAARLLGELASEDAGLSRFGASPSRNVVLTAPVLGPSGYAAEGRELFLALERDPRIHVSLRPLRFGALPCDEDPEFLEAVRTASERTPSGDYDAIHLVFPRQFRPDPAARTNILRTMFETDAVPATWVPHLQKADELWVPSAFHLRSFGRVYPESRIRCVPEFVSKDFLAVPQRRRNGATRFLSIFDWSTRKAPELLLHTFGATFASGEAELWLLMSSSLRVPAEELETRARALLRRGAYDASHAAPELRLLQGGLAPSAMPRVYAEMDAFVLASRGEGWGRPIHEAMASGLPVVATAFGGCADLLGGTGVAHIVDGRVVPVGDDAIEENAALAPRRETGSLDGQHRWLEPDPASLARAMREVHEHPGRAREMGTRARQHVAREFAELRVDWNQIAKPRARHRPTIRFEGPLLGSSSYARITRSLASAILDVGMCDVELRESVASPLPGHDPATFDGMLEPRIAARVVSGDDLMRERPDVCIRSGWPISCAPPHAGRWIQRFDWEYGAIPCSVVTTLDTGPDEIWVHSSVVRDALLAAGIANERIVCIPHGIDPARDHHQAPPLDALRRRIGDRFAFLFVGAAIPRKGLDVLLACWRRAFGHGDPVCLILKTARGADAYAGQDSAERAIEEAIHDRSAAEILVLDGSESGEHSDLTDAEMASLYTTCDCLVHPFRGEGFGMPLLEARAAGLPIVLTSGGAPDDFLAEAGCMRIPSTRRTVAITERCVGTPWLLEPDADALVDALRRAVREQTALTAAAREDAQRIYRDYTWHRTAEIVSERVARTPCGTCPSRT